MSPARYKYGKHPPSRFQIRESMYTATELLVYNALLALSDSYGAEFANTNFQPVKKEAEELKTSEGNVDKEHNTENISIKRECPYDTDSRRKIYKSKRAIAKPKLNDTFLEEEEDRVSVIPTSNPAASVPSNPAFECFATAIQPAASIPSPTVSTPSIVASKNIATPSSTFTKFSTAKHSEIPVRISSVVPKSPILDSEPSTSSSKSFTAEAKTSHTNSCRDVEIATRAAVTTSTPQSTSHHIQDAECYKDTGKVTPTSTTKTKSKYSTPTTASTPLFLTPTTATVSTSLFRTPTTPTPLTSRKSSSRSFSSTPVSKKKSTVTSNGGKSPVQNSLEAKKWSEYMFQNHKHLINLAQRAKVAVCLTSNTPVKGAGDCKLTASMASIQISLALEPNTEGLWESFVIPLSISSNSPLHSHSQYIRSIVLSVFKVETVLCNNAKLLISQLIDSELLHISDIHSLKFDDVCLASWLLDSDSFSKNDLSYTCLTYEVLAMNKLARELLTKFHEQFNTLKNKNVWNVYILELSLVSILVTMEHKGLQVDSDNLNTLDRVMSTEIKALEKKCTTCIGSPISLNSAAQVRQVLYDHLKLDQHLPKNTLYRTAKGQEMSTSEGMLKQLVPYHPLPSVILKHRQIYKIHSTYIAGMRGFIVNNVLKTQWDQTAASTGRLQSIKPNIQAIPKTSLSWVTDDGEKVVVCPRSVYVSRPGYTLLSVDFKQIELRIFAHITCDKKLIGAFSDDTKDIFEQLSILWKSKNVPETVGAERERAKKIVYSVMYGVGKYKLSQQLNITPMEAQSIMNRFLQEFPGIPSFTAKVIELCKNQGFAESILGRQRILPKIKSSDFKERSHAQRQAVNFTIQGSAADICKLAMKEVANELKSNSIDASLLVQIHDELLYEVLDADINTAKDVFMKCMNTDVGMWHGGIDLKVPLRILLKAGKSWANMQLI